MRARSDIGYSLVFTDSSLVDIPQVNGDARMNIRDPNHSVMTRAPSSKRAYGLIEV
jgi:hypothetical protein